MPCCRICLEELKRPASLPCGHIFCTQCIIQTVQAVKPYTHIHPCPICRLPYNIAPLDMKVVPSNLRPFITPSVRKVFLSEIEDVSKLPSPSSSTPTSPTMIASSSSRKEDLGAEVARLRAENQALQGSCAMWRRRAEMHGEANLGLLKFAKAMRDQMVQISRDRNELEERCYALKRSLDGDCDYTEEMSKYKSERKSSVDWEAPAAVQRDEGSRPDRESSLLPPLIPFRTPFESVEGSCSVKRASPTDSESDLDQPRKKIRISDLLTDHADLGVPITVVGTALNQVSFLDDRRRSV